MVQKFSLSIHIQFYNYQKRLLYRNESLTWKRRQQKFLVFTLASPETVLLLELRSFTQEIVIGQDIYPMF